MLALTSNTTSSSAGLTEHTEARRVAATRRLNPAQRGELGQFLTPAGIAGFMASLFTARPEKLSVLDAGAGVGTLAAAVVAAACEWDERPRCIAVTAFEIDAMLSAQLRGTLAECEAQCQAVGIEFTTEVIERDFIAEAVALLGGDRLFSASAPLGAFNCAILNPPYHKIHSDSETRALLERVGIETSNLYTAFLWLATRLLSSGGEIAAITPRSFCNGPYFKPFRVAFLRTMSLRRLHVFQSRDTAFGDDEVLQENIILHAVKADERGSVLITSSDGPDDETVTTRTVPYSQVVRAGDADAFIHVVADEIEHRIGERMRGLSSTLGDLDLAVSTGRVVDFRAREILRDQPGANTAPLIYPIHFADGFIRWPLPNSRKPNALALESSANELLVPEGVYVLVKRFSAKEERRRIVAAVFDSADVALGPVGFENHLNYFHCGGAGLPRTLAVGLAGFLNSTLVDAYFRQFNGHTQVNASDLRALKYPSAEQLTALGERIGNFFPPQNELDDILSDIIAQMDSAATPDPVKAKQKISEALEILSALQVPRAQQNDRSALTLLSLLDVKPETPWRDASTPQRGITEMMDYFREHFGISYAPNTRETVRRQTVHQFMEMGFIVLNPDGSTRPVNSPHICYGIELNALQLIRTFGTRKWKTTLAAYLSQAVTIRALQTRERTMTLIPVRLPNGETVKLTGGGQNELIKLVMEEFCPRFTQGGIVVYLGDAGDKMPGSEIDSLAALGVAIDSHGKMPDAIVHLPEKNWLVLIEAVTSHGPVDIKRHNDLKRLFKDCKAGLVFVTAFESRKAALRYLGGIAWETEVWVADEPTHLIHFNGERFLGPYPAT